MKERSIYVVKPSYISTHVQQLEIEMLIHNGSGLGVWAGFGAQSFNLFLKFNRSTKLQFCMAARQTQNGFGLCVGGLLKP